MTMLNRLTFSLASIILIFALAFVSVPVMAADDGPTVTEVVAYSGKVLLDANGDSVAEYGTTNYAATRADFRVKITLSHGVTRATGNLQARAGNASGFVGVLANATNELELPNTDGKQFVVQFVLSDSSYNSATKVVVIVSEDAFTGDTFANLLGSQASTSGSLNLPSLNPTATASFGDPTAVTGTAGKYTVPLTFDNNGLDADDDGNVDALSLSPTFSATYVEIDPKDGATVTVAATSPALPTGKLGFVLTIQLGFGVSKANPATISVPTGYVKGGASITLPPPPPVTQEPPSVSMQVTSHDPTLREFRFEVTFTPGLKSNGEPGDPVTVGKWAETTGKDFLPSVHLKFTDALNAVSLPTNAVDRASNNSYTAIFTYSLLDVLPLTITTVDDFKTSNDPRTSVMVGGQVTPSDITFTPNQIPNQTFVVNTAITPVYLPIATGGTTPYTYTLAPLPTGLAFNATTQELSGTPTTAGTTAMTYTATDAASRTGTLTFTIEVLAGDTPSVIPDTNLAAAVRRSLSLAANTPLTVAVMAQLTTLDAYSASVVQLNGLEHATNLMTLDLGMNQITNISTLASLTRLTHLYLDDNQITDVTALSGLTSLRLLRLAGNTIQNTAPLATLLQQNPGLDLDIPVTPPQDDSVTFTDAKLETAVRIALRMTATETITKEAMLRLFFLEAYDRRIASISGLEHATNLIALDLGKNAVVDITPLASLTELQILFLDNNQIVDVSPLAGLTQLDLLFLTGNPISSLAPISHLIDDIQIFRSKAEQ